MAFKINLFQTAPRCVFSLYFIHHQEDFSPSSASSLPNCPLPDVAASGFRVARVGSLPSSCWIGRAVLCVSCGLRGWPRVPGPCRRSFLCPWIFHLWMSWDQCPVFASPDRDHWSACLFTATHLVVFPFVFRGSWSRVRPQVSYFLLG